MTFTRRIFRLTTTINPPPMPPCTISSHRNYHAKPPSSPSNNLTLYIKAIFLDIFKDLEALVSTNECKYPVNNALKTDRIINTSPFNYVRVNITTQSMPVIPRKMRQK